MANNICTKCGNEITDEDNDNGNYREMVGPNYRAYKHIKCLGQPERKTPKIDWDAPLPEANPASWIVK